MRNPIWAPVRNLANALMSDGPTAARTIREVIAEEAHAFCNYCGHHRRDSENGCTDCKPDRI